MDDNVYFISFSILISICCVLLILCIFVFYLTSTSATSTLSTESTSSSLFNKIKTLTGLSTSSSLSNTNNNSLSINKSTTKKTTQLDCNANNLPNENFDCSNPINNKKIILKSGPIFKLSSSTEIDSFGKSTINYYILGSLSFMDEGIVSIATKEITINTLDDLLKFFDNMENNFNKNNKIPDKCLNVSIKIREESKEPYNTMCIFFPGLNKIDAIVKILESSLLPFLSTTVMNDYYNMIDSKLNKNVQLTILEYTMYLALLNKIKNSQFKYFTLCNSDNEKINC